MTDFREKVDQILSAGVRTFGETVKFYPSAGGIFTVRAIFNNSFHNIDPSTQQIVEVTQPNLGVNLNDLPFDVKARDQVEVRGIKYSVESKEEDGQGGATLFLHKVSLNERIKDTRVR